MRLSDQDLERLEKLGVGGGVTAEEQRALIAEVRRLRHALQDIRQRHEERDTGEGWVQDPGPLAWAMWRVAKDALNAPVIVVFRRYDNGELIALFPEDEDASGRCTAYDSDGFHGTVFYDDSLASTRPATPEQYSPLKADLEAMGYRLDVREQWVPAD